MAPIVLLESVYSGIVEGSYGKDLASPSRKKLFVDRSGVVEQVLAEGLPFRPCRGINPVLH